MTRPLSFLALVSLLACGGSPEPSSGVGASGVNPGAAGSTTAPGGAGQGGVAGQGGAAGAAGASGSFVTECVPEPGGVCVREVQGVLRASGGAPLPDKVVTVCGLGCFVGKTGGDGSFSVFLDALLKPEEYVLSAHGRPDHGSTYVRLPPLSSVVAFPGPVELPVLPPGGPMLPEDGAPASAVTAGPLTLSFEGDTVFDLDIDDIAQGPEGRRLRVATVEPGRATFVKDALFVVAMAPFGAKLSRPAGITLAGVPGVSEGQEVELLIMEDDLLADEGNLAGTPRVVAAGRVEGGVIRSEPGQGLDKITWLAVRGK